jgi:hypothetical protein
MVIDGAENCAYDIFAATDEEFSLLFPGDRQNIAFMDDIERSLPKPKFTAVTALLWKRPIEKQNARGIHGLLFCQLQGKKQFYPNRRDDDLDGSARNWFHGNGLSCEPERRAASTLEEPAD